MPPLFLDQNEARRAETFFWRPSPSSLSQSLDDRVPPLSEGLDPPLSQYPFSRGGQGQAVEVITDEIENFGWALIHLLMARDDDEKTALLWNTVCSMKCSWKTDHQNPCTVICYPGPLHSDSPTNPAMYQD